MQDWRELDGPSVNYICTDQTVSYYWHFKILLSFHNFSVSYYFFPNIFFLGFLQPLLFFWNVECLAWTFAICLYICQKIFRAALFFRQVFGHLLKSLTSGIQGPHQAWTVKSNGFPRLPNQARHCCSDLPHCHYQAITHIFYYAVHSHIYRICP